MLEEGGGETSMLHSATLLGDLLQRRGVTTVLSSQFLQ
jgi:hypothetical protein